MSDSLNRVGISGVVVPGDNSRLLASCTAKARTTPGVLVGFELVGNVSEKSFVMREV